mgnify:CR=1 FL=1
MIKFSFHFFSLFLVITFFLSGCATKNEINIESDSNNLTFEQRKNILLTKKEWQIKGKIAFYQRINEQDKRESASLNWQVNELKKTQELNLTSFLGINVLHLKSNQKEHLIKVDGKEYKDENLSKLIHSLTGLHLPTQALVYWLKGLPYNINDSFILDEIKQLPTSLISHYDNSEWTIEYDNYKQFDNIAMATNFLIVKDNLKIKVSIKNWHFNN